MSSTSRNKNLLSIIVILLLTNIAVLGYFIWFKRPVKKEIAPKEQRTGISEQLQKEVGFTDEQISEYKLLKDKQRENIRPMFDDMRKAKDSLFRLLSYPGVTDSMLNSAADGIARRQKMLDLQAFNHFRNVRAICRPEQQEKYDSMILRMFRRMGKPVKHDTEKK